MKKLSLIVALAVVLTIGGVFATWSYSDAGVDFADATNNVEITITPGASLGAAGSFAAGGELSYSILNPNSDYVAVLTPSGDGLTFTFTAAQGSTYLENGDSLAVKWTAKLSQNKVATGTQEGTKIFNVGDDLVVQTGTATLYADTTDNKNVLKITSAMLGLDMNDFKLDTKGEFTAFNTALSGTQIEIVVEAA